jgi:predicted dehydrogenase
MSKEQIGVALIGTGRIGQEHAKSLASIPWVRLEVVCDVRIEAARAFRAELEHFFACFADHQSPSPGPADALESLRIAVAATKSWKERRPVKLAEVAI